MNKLLLPFVTFALLNTPIANASESVNFHRNPMLGQYNEKIVVDYGGGPIEQIRKLCFISCKKQDPDKNPYSSENCNSKIIIDTESVLQYSVVCEGLAPQIVTQQKLSEFDHKYSGKSQNCTNEVTYTFEGFDCNSDSVGMCNESATASQKQTNQGEK